MNGVGDDMDSRSSPALHALFATGNLPRVCAEGIVEISPTASASRSSRCITLGRWCRRPTGAPLGDDNDRAAAIVSPAAFCSSLR